MLHTPGGPVAAEWTELAGKLVNGDGLGWSGDPRLDLRIGILTNKRTKKVGRRLEVHRTNEDGSETLVGHWLLSEQFKVIYDLSIMQAGANGRIESVESRVDKHNEALEAKALQDYRETLTEATEHGARLYHDLNNPRQKFYLNGDPNRGGRA